MHNDEASPHLSSKLKGNELIGPSTGINNLNYHFIIYQQNNLYDAISGEMYKRAIGASYFVHSHLHLIECSKEFNEFVINIIKDFKLNIQKYETKLEFLKNIRKNDEADVYIVDAWPNRIHIAKILKKFGFRVVLIEDHPISFERFNSNRLIDKFLVFPLIYEIRILKSRNIFKLMDLVVSNSNSTQQFLKEKWKFNSTFISYPPIHSHIFRYVTSKERNSVVIHWPSRMKTRDAIKITSVLDAIEFDKLWILNPGNDYSDIQEIFSEKIVVKVNYTFEEIQAIYSESFLAIIPERDGAFEIIPIESIASGVPVLGATVPSIEAIITILQELGIEEIPFFSLENLNINKFISWNVRILKIMPKISAIINREFSPENIMRTFVGKITYNKR